jgi:thiol-disulfide isomerase/thioredoxin
VFIKKNLEDMKRLIRLLAIAVFVILIATNCTREQKLSNKLEELQYPLNLKCSRVLDSLNQKLYKSEDEKKRLIKQLEYNQDTLHKVYIEFGKSNPNSYLGMGILYPNRNNIEKSVLDSIYNNLEPEFKNSKNGIAINVFLNQRLAEKGSHFIDFDAKTIEGKDFSLSSLKGKYVYLTFWSSSCGPCRMENKHLSQNFEKIPNNLEIVSFSVDSNRDYWEKASKQDKIMWHNVSDLEGQNGEIKTIYGVQPLPTSFLINKDGKIIDKTMGFDKDLIEYLEDMIN